MPHYCHDLKNYMPSDADMADLQSLLLQLDPAAPELTKDRVRRVMTNGRILVIRYCECETDGSPLRIVAMATLIFKEQIMGRFGFIEDVVVDEKHRQKGLGSWLTKALIARAETLGMMHLDLTSRPHRVAANKMYEKLGFVRRDTNVYRFVSKNKRL